MQNWAIEIQNLSKIFGTHNSGGDNILSTSHKIF